MWFKKHKWKVLLPALVLLALAAAFLLGGKPQAAAPQPSPGMEVSAAVSAEPPEKAPATGAATAVPGPSSPGEESQQPEEGPVPSPEESLTPAPSGAPDPVPSPVESEQPAESSGTERTCTLSISCATILNNMERLDPNKKELVPADGWLLMPVSIPFQEGETVFDVLQRTLRDYGIHMESSNTPMYDSIYIEGIGNLYELDCGGQSGWMYRVNGAFPNYGCSKYTLSDGDAIEWVYTCDLGYDVGGGHAAGG